VRVTRWKETHGVALLERLEHPARPPPDRALPPPPLHLAHRRPPPLHVPPHTDPHAVPPDIDRQPGRHEAVAREAGRERDDLVARAERRERVRQELDRDELVCRALRAGGRGGGARVSEVREGGGRGGEGGGGGGGRTRDEGTQPAQDGGTAVRSKREEPLTIMLCSSG